MRLREASSVKIASNYTSTLFAYGPALFISFINLLAIYALQSHTHVL